MKSFLKSQWLFLLAAFFLPLLVMFLAFLANGIYWNGPTTILAGDGYHQYVSIATLYRDILHSQGAQGFLYSWTNGLGLDLYAFSSYYMGSFFMPLTYFFDAKTMPDALYLITLFKFGTIGASAFIAFKNMYKAVSSWWILALAIAFSMMSFLTSQNEIPMWQDVFILIPLIIWGLHSLMARGKRTLYFVSLVILFIQNYYFGFILAIFLGFYFLVRQTLQKWSIKRLLDFLLISFLAVVTSLIMLLPMYLDLKSNGQNFSAALGLFSDNSFGLDLFAKNMVAVYDTTQYGAVPMIYVGLFTLLIGCCFFFIPTIKWQTKTAYAALLVFIALSFYLQVLDLAWQGMHTPNMFLHRYAFVFPLLLVLMALEVLVKFDKLKLRYVLGVALFFSIGFILSLASRHYIYLTPTLLILTLLFLAAYLVLLIGYKRNWLVLSLFSPLLVLFVLVEAGVNSYYQIAGVKAEWNYPSRSYYNQQVKKLSAISEQISKDAKNELTRTDNTNPDTANDGMKYGYNTIAQFSSVRNSNSSSVMSDLGFQTDGDYLNLRYPSNTLLMDALFAVKYNINEVQPTKWGFSTLPDAPIGLTKNSYAQGIGLFVPSSYQDANFISGNPIVNQTNFLNNLTHQKIQYFQALTLQSQKSTATLNTNSLFRTSLSKKAGDSSNLSVTYTVTVPKNTQAYIQVPDISYENSSVNTLIVSTPTASYSSASKNVGSLYNLGYYDEDTPITVTLSFPQNSWVSFDNPKFWALDVSAFSDSVAKISETPVLASNQKNGAKLAYTSTEKGQIFLTIPYDKGWRASIDGKKVSLQKAQSGFMKFDAPIGHHAVSLNFWPNGLSLGIIAFVFGILSFIFYNWLEFWKSCFKKVKSSLKKQV